MRTQEDKVIYQLETTKSVSRNWCLQLRITRLGAIICDLNKKGWNLKGHFVKTSKGQDYVYENYDQDILI